MMHVHKEQTDFYQMKLLPLASRSKAEFIKEYKKYDATSAGEFYLQVLIQLKKTILEGNINNLKSLSNVIDCISSVESQTTLKDYYDNRDNPIKGTNLVILACKQNKVGILQQIFGNCSKILNNLSIGIKRTAILPADEDETCHNAFYYAIHSGNVDLLDTLIKWPGNYFDVHLEELEKILSRAYEELKLKYVLLSDEIEYFVENKLINLRFFSNTLEQDKNINGDLNNIRERIQLVLQNINFLKIEYSNTEKVDEKFLFVLKFIAQNIYILKRLLKSTYDRLPWEEIEFCLVIFVSSHTKREGINLFYHAILNKEKILKFLENFAEKLQEEKNALKSVIIDKIAHLPNFKREEVIAEIIRKHPLFKELYDDYQQIRDIHSLDKINNCIKLASSACPKDKEGQLIITRVLQVIGELLKNTLESPKLSDATSELFLLSLPKNTRKVITDLRNSLSKAYSLSKRAEIEENTDINFFIGVQNDINKVGDVITDILYNYKIKTIRMLLKRIVNSKNLDEIKEVSEVLGYVEFDKIFSSGNFKMMEHEKLENLIKKLSDVITNKTDFEVAHFNKINNLINIIKKKSVNMETGYIMGYASLKSLSIFCSDIYKIDHNIIRGIKFRATKTLENIIPQIQSHSFNDIAELLVKISHSVKSRMQPDNLDEINRLIYKFFNIIEFGTGDIKYIEKLREKLDVKSSFTFTLKGSNTYDITEEKYNTLFALKVSELKSTLSNNSLNSQSTEKLSFYKSDKKLQAVIEMLVLDIMSILGRSSHYLENNLLFLEDNTPLLTGKCLRNHLAHDNAIVDVLLSDPSIAIILNAKKLTEENIMKSKKKIGKLVSNNLFKLEEKYNQGLFTISNQERMFVALEEGNLENLKDCLKKGTDINAKNMYSWTTLHFAAKGPSLEAIKFILDQDSNVSAKDVNGQNPLHIAAAYGRKSTVEFFVKEAGFYVDGVDNHGKTSLHIAAQNGQKDTVEVLLKNKANTLVKDLGGLSPLHCAIRNNHIDVAKILLKKDTSVDINEARGGHTPLHQASEFGHLELFNFLVQNKADVNARTDRDWTPLHAAAFNGHLELVNALILKGANVCVGAMGGCTALHYAVENGHEEIVDILLKHGANVNAVDKTYNNTPLHYATQDGHKGIVKSLLKYNANASIATVEGITPLHFAIKGGYLEIVTALLSHGVNINAKDKNNDTPLHYAAEHGNKEVVELLIKNGAEINSKSYDFMPLSAAALKDHKDIVNLLIKNKANVNGQDINGSTALHAAASNGAIDVIDLLIKNKAEVNSRTKDGITPLHSAALNGCTDAIGFLIENGAEVNITSNCGFTPLYLSVVGGHKDVVDLLVKNKAHVNAQDITDRLPLNIAVESGHKEIIQILIANGANVNSKNNTPLLSAVKCNNKEIVEILISNGANVNAAGGEPLSFAILAGHRDIVDILLKNKANFNMKNTDNSTALHIAATRHDKEIVIALIKRGADVNAITTKNITSLHLAAGEGREEIVQILIANGANVNVKAVDGSTPLHIAGTSGHSGVVKVLLDNQANINVKDDKNRTPLELTVAHGHLQVTKILLEHEKVDMNAKGNDDWTVLHIAAQGCNLEILKYLINKGSDINARNASGSKPIHIAAREGYKDTVEFLLSKGSSIDDLGAANQNLLHYASMEGRLEVVKYLIAQAANVNAKDANGSSPMHIGAQFGYKEVIEVLLENGAIYNSVDKLNRKPLQMANNKDIINLLASTEKLFEAIKHNSASEVENCIKGGAFVSAKNADDVTPLHYAAWKGYDGIVNVLLQNKANPNAIGKKGATPLHYAAKFSHLKVVKTLLSNGAIYNAVSDNGKTPSDFTEDKCINNLFKLLNESFKNTKIGNSKVLNDLNKIKDIDTIKAIMSARNKGNKTLIVNALHNNFPSVEQLKQVLQDDVSAEISMALVLLDQGHCKRSLSIFKRVFEKRKEILGPDNPGTLDIQAYIAKVLYKQGAYQDALKMSEEIFQKQKEILGLNDKDTLRTKSMIALVLHRQEKNEEAFNIYQDVYLRQKEILGPNHSDILDTQFHMALVLNKQGKYEEALDINRAIFKKKIKKSGVHDPFAVRAQNNIAMVLASQGKHEEALEIYKEVLEKKKVVLGINHSDTLRTSHSIAAILLQQNKYSEALKTFKEVLDIQKNVLGPNHPDTLNTQCNLANVLFTQGKWIGALKAYNETLDQAKAVLGPNHPHVEDILQKIEMINMIFKFEGSEASEFLQNLQKDINIAASNGDIEIVQRLLKDGVDVNDKDIDGRTALHYAVSSGHTHVVEILLQNGADVAQITNKGNTPLHTATAIGNREIVEVLLQHVSHDKSNEFIDIKTTFGGTASLHVAAKNGTLEIVKSLLKHGATYNIKNKESKIPLNLSKDQSVINLLKLVEELFEDAKKGNIEIINKLRVMKPDVFLAVTNTRDKQKTTLLQVAILNKNKNITGKLLRMLQKTS